MAEPPTGANGNSKGSDPVGSPVGFSKGVNDYLNHYVTVADAKAGAILAASLAVAVLILDGDAMDHDPLWLQRGSVAFLAISVACCAYVIFPRLPSGKTGLIFWEDIRSRSSRSDYARDVATADTATIEREYASQNWFVSQVLHDKHRLVRRAIIAFLVAVTLAALGGAAR